MAFDQRLLTLLLRFSPSSKSLTPAPSTPGNHTVPKKPPPPSIPPGTLPPTTPNTISLIRLSSGEATRTPTPCASPAETLPVHDRGLYPSLMPPVELGRGPTSSASTFLGQRSWSTAPPLAVGRRCCRGEGAFWCRNFFLGGDERGRSTRGGLGSKGLCCWYACGVRAGNDEEGGLHGDSAV